MSSVPRVGHGRRTLQKNDPSKAPDDLSEGNLRKHTESTNYHTTFKSTFVREERARMFHQSAYAQCQDNKIEPGHFGAQNLQSVTKLSGPMASSLKSLMQQFCTIGPVNDPQPWSSNQAIHDRGLTVGSTDSVQIRIDAARALEADLGVAAHRDDASETSVQPMYPRARDCLKSDKVAVKKPVRQVARRADGEQSKRRKMK